MLEDVSISLTNLDVDGTVLLDQVLKVNGRITLDIFLEEDNFIGMLSITPEPTYYKLCENMQL